MIFSQGFEPRPSLKPAQLAETVLLGHDHSLPGRQGLELQRLHGGGLPRPRQGRAFAREGRISWNRSRMLDEGLWQTKKEAYDLKKDFVRNLFTGFPGI